MFNVSDSPALSIPEDPKERPILDALLNIRTLLEFQRIDKSTCVKSEDIVPLYDRVIAQVKVLNEIRKEKRHEQNRVDHVLDDCFRLISLSFLASGKTCDPPAVYAAVSTIKRLLDHLAEAAFFSLEDLYGIGQTLAQYQETCANCKQEDELMTLLKARMEICQQILNELQESLSDLDHQSAALYSRLVSILRSLSALNTKKNFSAKEVDEYVYQLQDIEKKLDVEHVEDSTGRSYLQIYEDVMKKTTMSFQSKVGPRPAETLIKELLYRCFVWAEIIKEKKGKIDPRFQRTYDELVQVRNKLEHLTLCQSWSIQETDLYYYQRQLDFIDDSRVDGHFLDPEGNPSDIHAERTLLYLIRKSYAFIFYIIISSEPVSSALLPIYNQLKTLKKCLEEVKAAGGVSSPHELYPYSMKLASLEKMRVNGNFMVNGEVPEGQNTLTNLMNECFELAKALRVQATEHDQAGSAPLSKTSSHELTAVK